ncbi:hypothetical protein NKH48_32905, partial [Mesorhizobium sp. M1233]|uniref:hypothetical protein n=1 Tax=Mesorhizobium sp. M1233 TaxID=2957072 RepID=UPI003339DD65
PPPPPPPTPPPPAPPGPPTPPPPPAARGPRFLRTVFVGGETAGPPHACRRCLAAEEGSDAVAA